MIVMILTTIMTAVVVIMATAIVIPIILFRAYVLNILWGWFVTPVLGIVAPGYMLMLGFTFFTSLLFSHPVSVCKDERESKQKITDAIAAMLTPFFALCVGWLIKYFGGL